MKLNAKELRTVDEDDIQEEAKNLKRHPIYFILENVYDTYNIGGLFRLADAIGVSKMYLCGQMEIPPNSKIKKASIGTYKIVPWEYKKTAKEAIEELKTHPSNSPLERGGKGCVQIIAVEQNEKSIPYTQINYSFPVALILGNETFGVTKETLALADHIAEIPMWGINKSLNVIVSAAIVSYHVMGKK
ncbi:hypothetical protein HZC27_01700 [Candidatus Roizmanbacteria bacterium]|nr:hypothetical protein [Candidatus Roizmanbacteria bacterium]